MNDDQLLRYSRHILLNDFDIEGQEKLLASTVLIVGAGGLGCPAAMYLASSGIGEIIIADDDVVELSNLQRQIGHAMADIDSPKVESLKQTLSALNPDVKVTAVNTRLDENQMAVYVQQSDVLVDCSDNFKTRFLLNRFAVEYKKPLVSGAAIRTEAQLVVFDSRDDKSPCYRCLYSDDVDSEQDCSSNGVLAPLVGIVGSMQAFEVIRLITGFGESSVGALQMADLKHGGWRSLTLARDPECPVCGSR
ncbi:MAG: molybdopterin-synthase adenylyltransferase MoeB [Pseudomonadales bacterium]|nr:molybdopterin-synthase adenylyltransferase MoeB [Pseudomonadales bacterium]